MYHFITQGYACSAIILFFGYCFFEPRRDDCYQMARVSNMLIWAFSVFLIPIILYGFIITRVYDNLFMKFLFNNVMLLFTPFIIVIVPMLFKKLRKNAVWLLVPIALILNPGIFTGHFPEGGWFNKLSGWSAFLLYGTCYFLLLLLIRLSITSAKKKSMS